MPQRVHFNAKTLQLSLSLQVNTQLVLRESGDRNLYIIPRAVPRTFVWRVVSSGGGSGTNKLLKNTSKM